MGVFEEAAHLAVDAHAGSVRKGDGSPYVFHPFEVAAIVAGVSRDEEVIAAALLHDVVEDTSFSAEELRRRFGNRVADLVASETEDKREGIPPEESWRIRKEESLAELEGTDDPGVKLLWLADKLSNLRSLARMREREGDAMWNRFHMNDPKQQEWYYRGVAERTVSLAHTRPWREYSALIEKVFGGIDDGRH